MKTGMIIGILAVLAVIIAAIFVLGNLSVNYEDQASETSSDDSLVVVGDESDTYGANPESGAETTPETSGNNEYTVEVLSSGFSPKTLEINQGDTVTWVNKRSSSSWPASNNHPTHEIYPEFDAKMGLKTGETYSFTFEKTGSWGYHDHLSSSTTGTIIVN